MGNGKSKRKNRGKNSLGGAPGNDLTSTPQRKDSLSSSLHPNTSNGAGNKKTSPNSSSEKRSNTPRGSTPKSSSKDLKQGSKKSDDGFSQKKLEKLFEKYRDANDPESIGPEGIERFCADLGIKPEDAVVLVMAWHLNAAEMAYFSKQEFLEGFKKLGCDSIDKIRGKFGMMREEMEDPNKLKEIYRFAFNFAKDDPEKKVIDIELADGMLELLLKDRPHVAKFRKFLHQQKSYKVINVDQWMSFFEFSRAIKDDFSDYDENGAWPVLLDEYVEAIKVEKEGGNKESKRKGGDGSEESDEE